MNFIIAILFFLVPALIIYFSEQFNIIKKIGTVVFAYIIGFLIGNSGLINSEHSQIQDIITTITIPLALPLLLFSFDYSNWKNIAGNSLKSLITGIVSVIIIVIIGNNIFANQLPDSWKLSGMLVGVYSGGTPNLAALKAALNVDDSTYILVHSIDMFISSLYLLFFITIGKHFYGLFLKKYNFSNQINLKTNKNTEIENYKGILSKSQIKPNLISLALSILIFAIGGILSLLVPKDFSMLTAILSITALSIAFSFSKIAKTNNKNFELGMYFILVFSMTVASMADFSTMKKEIFELLEFVSFVVIGSMILHIILSKIFKIDRDTTMICSVALICSPPFVPLVASALKNKQIIISGLTIGIIGYAVGNYIGVMVAYFLK